MPKERDVVGALGSMLHVSVTSAKALWAIVCPVAGLPPIVAASVPSADGRVLVIVRVCGEPVFSRQTYWLAVDPWAMLPQFIERPLSAYVPVVAEQIVVEVTPVTMNRLGAPTVIVAVLLMVRVVIAYATARIAMITAADEMITIRGCVFLPRRVSRAAS